MSSFLLPDAHLNLLAFAVKEYIPAAFTGSHQSLVDILRDANEENVRAFHNTVSLSTPPWEKSGPSLYTAPKLPDFLSAEEKRLGILVAIESYFYQCSVLASVHFPMVFSVLHTLRLSLLESFDPPLFGVWDARLDGLSSLFWRYMESQKS